eukprot:m.56285 g.56285  ORF g.56285 m.56285 type:complete len:580 (+) comp34585_c0_seq1:1421-3160(+)
MLPLQFTKMQKLRSPSLSLASDVFVDIPTAVNHPASEQRCLSKCCLTVAVMLFITTVAALIAVAAIHRTHGAPVNMPESPLVASFGNVEAPALTVVDNRESRQRNGVGSDDDDEGIEDDIILPTEGRNRRAVNSKEELLWDEAIVPYQFDRSIDAAMREDIRGAMRHWEDRTCLRFQPHVVRGAVVRGRDFIYFNATGSCQSYVGRIGGNQTIHLKYGSSGSRRCSIIHEIGHAIGFWHEHTRPDRDEHVRINWNNIKKVNQHNFWKRNSSEINSNGGEYDFDSVMHYGANTFSSNHKETISVLGYSMSEDERKRKEKNMGQRAGLSEGDIEQANALYKCKERTYPDRRSKNGAIKNGQTVALRFDQSPPGAFGHQWFRCPNNPGSKFCGKPKATCAGYEFDSDDWYRCNAETFRIHAFGRLANYTIRVGDIVALESGAGSGNYLVCHGGHRCRLAECPGTAEVADEQLRNEVCKHRKFVVTVRDRQAGTLIRDRDVIGLRDVTASTWMSCRKSKNKNSGNSGITCRKTSCSTQTASGDGAQDGWLACDGVPFTITKRAVKKENSQNISKSFSREISQW